MGIFAGNLRDMINFNVEVEGFRLTERTKKKSWLKNLIQSHGKKVGELNYIFLSDEELLEINIQYLDHHTYTDIITFDNSDEEKMIEGDIFISVDRVRENAQTFKVSFEQELLRVMAHGVLHLLGLKDKTEEDSKLMRAGEEKAIAAYFSLES
jgi:probable rRNA maturation factor